MQQTASKMKILIRYKGLENKNELSARRKKEALGSSRNIYLDCDQKDRVKFSGYDSIHHYSGEKRNFDFILQKKETEDSSVLYPFKKEKDTRRSYLLVLKKEENEDIVFFFLKRLKEKKENAVFFSRFDHPIDSLYRKESLSSLFKEDHTLSVLSYPDYQILSEAYLALRSFKENQKKKKKNRFSDIGNYFFKNYVSHPKEIIREDLLSFYGMVKDNNTLLFNIYREGSFEEYQDLFEERKKVALNDDLEVGKKKDEKSLEKK